MDRSFFKHYTVNFGDLTTDEYTDTVQVISLDEVLKIANTDMVDFLKIDAEGSEVEILTGASKEELKKIKKIAIEYHDAIRPNCSEILVNTLARNGFFHIVVEPNAKLPGYGIIRAKR
jgi:hypothetical protein